MNNQQWLPDWRDEEQIEINREPPPELDEAIRLIHYLSSANAGTIGVILNIDIHEAEEAISKWGKWLKEVPDEEGIIEYEIADDILMWRLQQENENLTPEFLAVEEKVYQWYENNSTRTSAMAQ